MAKQTPGSKCDTGSKYELSVTALFASLLSKNENVEDYRIFSNLADAQPFDDIVAEVQFKGLGYKQIYAVQVKSGKDKLNINKYWEGYDKIMREGGLKLGEGIRNKRIQFWYFCSKRLTKNSFRFTTNTNIIELTLKPRSRSYNLHESIFSNTVHFELFFEDPSIIDYQNFFNNFSLFLNQPDTQKNIYNIKGIWRIDDPLQILLYLENYFVKNKNGLDKRTFEHELLRNRLSSYMVIPTTVIQFHHEAVKEWNQLTLKQDVTIVRNELNIEQYLFGCILRNICSVISVDEWNRSVKNMGKLEHNVKNRLKTKIFKPETLKDLVVRIWMDGKAPLLLKVDIVLPFIRDFSHLNKSYIIIDSDVDKRHEEIKSYGLRAFRHLGDVETDELTRGILVSLQGRKPVSLYSIINGDKQLKESVTCLDIIKMMKPREAYLKQDCLDGNNSILFIIETTNAPQQNYHGYHPTGNNITKYCKPGGSYELYKKIREDSKFRSYAIFRLHSIGDEKFTLLPKINGQETAQEEGEEQIFGSSFVDQHGESLYNKENGHPIPIIGEHPIHICARYIPRYLREGVKDPEASSLSRRDSNKDNIAYNGKRFAEKDFFEESTDSIAVVTGEPGMGKTTLLCSLSRLCESRYYVIFVNLTRCQVDLHERNTKLLQNPLRFWCDKHGTLPYSNILTSLCDHHRRIVLLLDAFDEVIATCEEQVLELIQNLQKLGLKKIIIASRLTSVNLLIDSFKTEIFKIEGFSQQVDEHYIENWNLNFNSLRHIPSEFLTNPLYLNMLRTISENGINLAVVANRWNLYESIVNLKMEEYCRRMKPNLLDKTEKYNILSHHWQLALEAVFGSYNVTQKLQQTKLPTHNKFINLGFIIHFDINQNPIFIHHTFAEFFVMQWLIANVGNENAVSIYTLMLKDKRHILDMLSEKFRLHRAVLHESVEKIEKLFIENEDCLLEIDDLGRSVLHLAALTSSRDYFHRSNRLNVLLHFMRRKGYDIYVRDKIFDWTWINYWENYVYVFSWWKDEYVATLEAYLNYYVTHIEELEHSKFSLRENFCKLYNAAIKYSSIDMIRDLLFLKYHNDKVFLKFRRRLDSGRIKKKKLLNFKFRKEKLGGVHLACIYSNIEAVQIFVENRTNLNKTDIFNCTPLHYSVISRENNEIVKLLLANSNMSNVHAGQDNDTTILHMSVRTGNVNITKMLLESVDVNVKDAENCTALLAAIETSNINSDEAPNSKYLEIIEKLLQHKADLNFEALDRAVMYGKKDILEMLIKCGADVNSNSNTLLCKAIKEEHMEIIELLLRHGAYANDVDHIGWTPLIYSVKTGNRAIIQMLLDYNADVNLKSERNIAHLYRKTEERTKVTKLFLKDGDYVSYGGVYGDTALSVAIVMEDKDIIQILLNHNADVNSRNMEDQTPLYMAIHTKNLEIIELLLKGGACINFTDIHGWDPLSYAIYGGSKDAVQMLLSYNADVNLRNRDRRTPLYKGIYVKNLEIIELLLKCGARVNILDLFGCNPLSYAIEVGNKDIVQMLLKYNTDVNLKNNKCRTALYSAIHVQKLEIIELLLKVGAQVNIQDLFRGSPLTYAVCVSDKTTVETLLDYNADVNFKCHNERTPLYEAIYRTDLEVIELLLNRGAQVNILDLLGYSPLKYAICMGSKETIQLLLNFNADVNFKDNNNRTPLYKAIKKKDLEAAEMLLKCGAQVSHLDAWGWSPLSYAVHKVNKVMVEMLLTYSADVNFKGNNNFTPLCEAIETNDLEIIELLLKSGAHINVLDSWGWSPLRYAFHRNSKDIVQMLLNYGADVNFQDNNNRTPLYDAIKTKDLEIIELLLKCSAHVNILDSSEQSPLCYAIDMGNKNIIDMLLTYSADVNFKNNDNRTPLYNAIRTKDLEIIEMLLKHGAHVNILGAFGMSPLSYAVYSFKNIVEMLLTYGADVNFIDSDSRTPLYHAIEAKDLGIVGFLLISGALVNILDSWGWSPLSYAFHTSNRVIIEMLLTHNADANFKGNYNRTPLYDAIKTKKLDTTELLLKCGAHVNILDSLGWSPLSWAAHIRNKDIVELLLKYSADVNFKSNSKDTPLFNAIKANDMEIIELLLKCGAHVNVLHSLGWSPLSWAAHLRKKDIVELLLTYSADVNFKGGGKSTPLYNAIKVKDLEIIELLLKSGAHVNILNSVGWSPLSWALHMGNKDIVEMLLTYDADVNFGNKNNTTPLHRAIKTEDLKIIELLLKCGAHVNVLDSLGISPLSYAVYSSKGIVEMLLTYSADVNFKDGDTRTPLYHAIKAKDLEIIELLLKRGAHVNVLHSSGWNTVGYAVHIGNKDSVEMLLSYGADVNFKEEDNSTPLYDAIKTKDLELIEMLLKRGAHVNILDSSGRSPLSYAVCSVKDIVEMLLTYGADVNFNDDDSRTPLYHAIKAKDLKITELLLKCGAHVNVLHSSGLSTLGYAIHKSNKDTVEMLLTYDADVNFKEEGNGTPLYDAIKTTDLELIEMLLKSGAHVNILDSSGRSPLSYAVCSVMGIVEILLTHGADVNLKDSDSRTPLYRAIKEKNLEIIKLILKYGGLVNILDSWGWSPLSCAIHTSNRSIIEVLLTHSADANFKDNNSRTPLYDAIKTKNLVTTELLLKCGAHVNILDSLGWSPLSWAVRIGSKEIVKMLLTYSADVNFKDNHSRTPVYNAIKIKDLEVTELLLKSGAHINILDSFELSPLSHAVRIGNKEIVEVLLTYSADVNYKNNDNGTSLYHAIEAKNLEIIELLLKCGAHVNILDSSGLSPMNYAVHIGNKDTVEVLLTYGADVNFKDNNNRSPLYHAIKIEDLEVIELLLKRGAQVNVLDLWGLSPLRYATDIGCKEAVQMLMNYSADANYKV